MDTDLLIGFAVIAAIVLLLVWASRRSRRRGHRSGDYDAGGAFVFADTSDSSSSCDSGGDSGGFGDCGGGGGD